MVSFCERSVGFTGFSKTGPPPNWVTNNISGKLLFLEVSRLVSQLAIKNSIMFMCKGGRALAL
jgi:hypothetical protein